MAKLEQYTRTYLKKLRYDNNYTQPGLAKKLGISLKWLDTVEKDKPVTTDWLIEFFIKISPLFNVSVTDLMLLETEYQVQRLRVLSELEKINSEQFQQKEEKTSE